MLSGLRQTLMPQIPRAAMLLASPAWRDEKAGVKIIHVQPLKGDDGEQEKVLGLQGVFKHKI